MLARDSEAGAELVWSKNLIDRLINLIRSDANIEAVQAAIRLLDELAKNEQRVSWGIYL